MRRAFIALPLLALAACALPEGAAPRPDRVSLGGTQMAVSFPDGTRCTADVPLTGGTGQLSDCAYPLDWQVAITKRNYLEPILGVAVSPYATVSLTDAAGRTTQFRLPVPARDWR